MEKGFCVPTIIGAVFSAVAVIAAFMHEYNTKNKPGPLEPPVLGESPVHQLVISLITVGILWLLCYYGHEDLAWIFLLLPLILVVLLVLVMFRLRAF